MDRYIVKVGENVDTKDEIWAEFEFDKDPTYNHRHCVQFNKLDHIGGHFWLDKMLNMLWQVSVGIDEE